jgi:hypothetical protein
MTLPDLAVAIVAAWTAGIAIGVAFLAVCEVRS